MITWIDGLTRANVYLELLPHVSDSNELQEHKFDATLLGQREC